ncbi:Serine/threonine-protein phosphatase 5 [Smittium culicis]|uniref:Serine/threonine-protein phosphatase n=1 Tax=Smittium culicis TaxID=133412 RepID=A0A1R1X2I2_9FUNG|nr:Serine/threonine-protein phosphatase 5 [Smittium culicis]
MEKYTDAIALNPSVPAYYTNRAQCYILTEGYGAAIIDADKAIELNPKFVKGYYRRASAYMAMGNIKKACLDYKIVSKFMPNDSNEDSRPLSERLNIDDYSIDGSYTGPTMKIREPEKLSEDSIKKLSIEKKDKNESDLSNKEPLEYVDEAFVKELTIWFKDQKKLPARYVYVLLLHIIKLLKELPSLVDIDISEGSKLIICGDVHGQYYDLLNIFKLAGSPSPTNGFLFNGDFVDRGSFSVETVILLFSYKLLYPNSFFLNRGNHESISMNKFYGFEGEVLAKFGSSTNGKQIFELFTEAFNCLPVSHVVKNQIYVVHGGLYSEDVTEEKNGVTLDMIRKIDRFKQPGDSGLLAESLWSDPQALPGRSPNRRGVAIQFGPDVTEQFLKLNNLKMIVRSHEQKDNGYEIAHDGKCVTVFSAPNYCDEMGNLGAFMEVSPDLSIKYTTFAAVEHPPVKSMAYANMNSFY